MIVICEACGKKYRVDPNKITGERARFRCKACQHIIVVERPKRPEPVHEEEQRPEETQKVSEVMSSEPVFVPPEEPKKEEPSRPLEEKPVVETPAKQRRFGLRAKMMLLFFLVPLLVILGTGMFYTIQLNELARSFTAEGLNITTRLSEDMIAQVAHSVASQCKIFLDAHPGLDSSQFNTHPAFKRIAVQPVGFTGYTALYEIPNNPDDPKAIWRTWAHANPKIVGIDMKSLKDDLKENFPGFWKIFTGVRGGKDSKGYYSWKDPDGRIREKFMVCTPIKDTNYVIAATTYIDEFTQPMKELEKATSEQVQRVRDLSLLVLAVALAIFGVVVSLFGHRITGKIKELTSAADRISVGDLDFAITTRSNDEIGDLAEAISRMQDSIKLSIERLRRRRG